jgi:hypothetical protein
MNLNKMTQIRTVDGILENQEEKNNTDDIFFEILPLILFLILFIFLCFVL